MSDLQRAQQRIGGWRAPVGWRRITSLDTHTGGEPLRIFTSGLPDLGSGSVRDKRARFAERHDDLRTALILEPRGHADMYGAVVTDAADDADLDVFFFQAEGYSPMCGHAILAIAKVAFESGLAPMTGENPTLLINTPSGRVLAGAEFNGGQVAETFFENVDSFVDARDREVEVDGLGRIRFDIAFGGAFYALIDETALGLPLSPPSTARFIDAGRRIKHAINSAHEMRHPVEDEVSELFGVIFIGAAHDCEHHSRNVTVFGDGQVDRSPTGTGISARAALLVDRGELDVGQTIMVESVIGSLMTVTPLRRTTLAGRDAIIPRVGGVAHITGASEFLFSPDDELNDGFCL